MYTSEVIKRITSHKSFEPHKQTFVILKDSQNDIIDQAMITFHPSPNSYTGEDLAEISCHGNPLIVERTLQAISSSSLARLANNGEFTRRAFLNGKMDLVQAEAVGALISSPSSAGIDMSQALLKGELSKKINELIKFTDDILSDIEASFITEDAEIDTDVLLARIASASKVIKELLEGAAEAKGLYKGIVTTIAGLPNAGKSSLFNAILGYDRAIVHHEEGTTRDVLKEHLLISGIDYIFHDTAGIRETLSGPEQLGVEKTIDALKKSDLVLYVVDARDGITEQDMKWLGLANKTIIVMNKIDLIERPAEYSHEYVTVDVSAKYSLGIDRLLSEMRNVFIHDIPLVFLDRHSHLLVNAQENLSMCELAIEQGLSEDAIAFDLKQAIGYLRQISGEAVDTDILDKIFSRFCIGK